MTHKTQNKESIKLNDLEILIYFLIWSLTIAYSIYHVYLLNSYFINYDNTYQDFRPGWSWTGREIDISDREWRFWIPFIYQSFPWIIFHLIINRLIKSTSVYNKVTILSWCIFSSLIFIWHYIGSLGVLISLIQPCIARLLISVGDKKVCWFVHLLSICIIYYDKTYGFHLESWLDNEEEKYYLLTIALCWMQLRSLSCSIDSIDEDRESICLSGFLQDFLQTTAYCLYLPTFFLGPIILYKEFVNGIERKQNPWTFQRLIISFLNLTRYIFWLFFTNFSMHFLYFNALHFYPEIVEKINPWAFFGMGYCMGQYFLNKYVIVYGIGSTFAKLDDIEAPPQPKCIARIHLYSDMWKHFDRGLYKFLLRYIYIPCSGSKTGSRKIFASFLCFSFVFLWHGMELFIFIWSFLNFLGLTIEYFAREIGKSTRYLSLTQRYLSKENNRRLNCIFASPLLAISAISNFYFFAGADIGHIYFRRLFFQDSWTTVTVLFLSLYCCCQVSIECKEREKLKENQ